MHKFICNSVGGKIVPQRTSKQKFFKKLLDSYESLNKKFIVTIEIVEKDINKAQISLYNAFILEAAEYFGNTYQDMAFLLIKFYPNDPEYVVKPIHKWTTSELDTFINQASALLAEQGFIFR